MIMSSLHTQTHSIEHMQTSSELEWEDEMPAGPEHICQHCNPGGSDQSLVHEWSTKVEMPFLLNATSNFLPILMNLHTWPALEGVISLHTMQPKDMHNSLHLHLLTNCPNWCSEWLSDCHCRQPRQSLIRLLNASHKLFVCIPGLRAFEASPSNNPLPCVSHSYYSHITLLHINYFI